MAFWNARSSRAAELVRAVAREYPTRAAATFALMVSLSLTEGIGLVLLVPLMQAIGMDVQRGSIGAVAGFVTSAFSALHVPLTLAAVLCVFACVSGLQALLAYKQRVFTDTLVQDFTDGVRQRLYGSIVEADWSLVSRFRSSDFVHALTAETDRVASAVYSLLRLGVGALELAVYVALALRLSLGMTSLVGLAGACAILASRRKVRAAHDTGEALSAATSELYAASIDHMGGLKTTKAYGADRRSARIFAALSQHTSRMQVDTSRVYADMRLWSAMLSVAVLSIMLYVAVEVFALPASSTFLLLFVFSRIMPRVAGLQSDYQYLVNSLTAYRVVEEFRERCERSAEPAPVAGDDFHLHVALTFERVTFSYGADEPPALRDLDLVIPVGKTTAIVGPSGAGKSTIADLAMGLITPNSGKILVDGAPLAPDRLRGWRKQIGYVAQDTFLFHDTVRANLLWARPEATDDDLERALEMAAAREFVRALPEGMETVLGDRGLRLSGGERQRLALARALLRCPALLILDEATSSLDAENERRIQQAIEGLHGETTILVIAHRLSTIRNADTIYVVEQGRVIESGSWSALLARADGRLRAIGGL